MSAPMNLSRDFKTSYPEILGVDSIMPQRARYF